MPSLLDLSRPETISQLFEDKSKWPDGYARHQVTYGFVRYPRTVILGTFSRKQELAMARAVSGLFQDRECTVPFYESRIAWMSKEDALDALVFLMKNAFMLTDVLIQQGAQSIAAGWPSTQVVVGDVRPMSWIRSQPMARALAIRNGTVRPGIPDPMFEDAVAHMTYHEVLRRAIAQAIQLASMPGDGTSIHNWRRRILLEHFEYWLGETLEFVGLPKDLIGSTTTSGFGYEPMMVTIPYTPWSKPPTSHGNGSHVFLFLDKDLEAML